MENNIVCTGYRALQIPRKEAKKLRKMVVERENAASYGKSCNETGERTALQPRDLNNFAQCMGKQTVEPGNKQMIQRKMLCVPTVNVLPDISMDGGSDEGSFLRLSRVGTAIESARAAGLPRSQCAQRKLLFNPIKAQLYKGLYTNRKSLATSQSSRTIHPQFRLLCNKPQILEKKRLKWYEARPITMYSQYYKHNYTDNIKKALMREKAMVRAGNLTTVASLLKYAVANKRNSAGMKSKIESAKIKPKGFSATYILSNINNIASM